MLMRLFAICTRLFAICRFMETVNHGFSIFSCFIKKLCILRILYLRWSTGGIYNQGSVICWRLFIITVIAGLSFINNHFIDFTKDFRSKAFAEIYHERWIKGQLFVIIFRITAKVLKVHRFQLFSLHLLYHKTL